jgi:hypothetical protein
VLVLANRFALLSSVNTADVDRSGNGAVGDCPPFGRMRHHTAITGHPQEKP